VVCYNSTGKMASGAFVKSVGNPEAAVYDT